MTRGFSVYLDIMRIVACLIVAASHLANLRYSGGSLYWIRRLDLGSDAVVIFFVLSGFLIAHTALKEGRSASHYAKARLSRIYSVALPAILFTLLIDRFGIAIDPSFYTDPFYIDAPTWKVALNGIGLTSQLHDTNLRLGTNVPYWSIAYEAWYYIAFGIAVFTRGWIRPILLLCVAGIVGLPIILLSGCWMIGVGLNWAVKSRALSQMPIPMAKAMTYAPLLVYIIALRIGVPDALQHVTLRVFNLESLDALGFSEDFTWDSLISLLFAIHLAGMYRLYKDAPETSTRYEAPIRWFAGATFTIYLFHHPILNFIGSFPAYDASAVSHVVLMAVATIVVCLLIAEVTERRLKAWKCLFNGIFARVSGMFSPGIKTASQQIT